MLNNAVGPCRKPRSRRPHVGIICLMPSRATRNWRAIFTTLASFISATFGARSVSEKYNIFRCLRRRSLFATLVWGFWRIKNSFGSPLVAILGRPDVTSGRFRGAYFR